MRVLHYPLSIVLSDAPDGFVDLLLLLARFGSSDPGAADINGDGACDVSDLLGLLAAFGRETTCGAIATAAPPPPPPPDPRAG